MMPTIGKQVLRCVLLAGLLSTPIALTAGGCGQVDSVCTAVCDCTKCSDRAWDECEIGVQASIDRGDAYDCAGDVEKYYDCVVDDGECNDAMFNANDCNDEIADVLDCFDDNSDIINFGSVGANMGSGSAGGTDGTGG